jgi:hypothetical protein
MACCEDCASKVRSTEFTRTVLTDAVSARPSLYNSPLSTNAKVLIPFKALLRRTNRHKAIQYKVGVIGSHGRIGQTLQGVGTMFLPGDSSNITSPVRSRVYEALTPGGLRIPGVRTPNKPERGYRCPEGFQYGGRFTDNRFSTCGQMLFDIPSLGETIRNIVASQVTRRGPTSGSTSRELGAVGAVDDVIVRRAAQIPRANVENKAKRASSIANAVSALGSSEDGTSLLVRADGFTLLPVVSARVLRTIPDNRNMENGSYVVNIKKPSSIGGEELGLLSNAGLKEVIYALPNGSTIGVRKKRQLTVGERRKLGRTVNSVSSVSTDADPAARLRTLVAETGSAMEYFEDFKNIDGPNDMLDARIGSRKTQIRRWAKEAFNGKGGKRVDRTTERQAKPSRVSVDKTSNVDEAVAMLDDNKSPFDISPSVVSQALKKSKAYKSRRSGSATLYERGDGKKFIEVSSSSNFQHIGDKAYSDIANYLGVDSPEIGLSGSGIRRGMIAESVDTAVDGAIIDEKLTPSEVDKNAVTKIAALDWLLDVRNRDSTTLTEYKKGNRVGVIAGMTGSSGLSGLSQAEIRRREAISLDKFMDEKRMVAFREYYEELTDAQRRQMIRTVEQLLARARQFSWEDYITRFSIDGNLSDAEKRHLQIVRRIFDSRVKILSSAKDRFVEILGR